MKSIACQDKWSFLFQSFSEHPNCNLKNPQYYISFDNSVSYSMNHYVKIVFVCHQNHKHKMMTNCISLSINCSSMPILNSEKWSLSNLKSLWSFKFIAKWYNPISLLRAEVRFSPSHVLVAIWWWYLFDAKKYAPG